MTETPRQIPLKQSDELYTLVCDPRFGALERGIKDGFTSITTRLDKLNGTTNDMKVATAVMSEMTKHTSSRVLFLERIVFGGIALVIAGIITAILRGVVILP